MEGPSEEVLRVYMLGSFLDKYYGSDRQVEVPCYICKVRKDGPLLISEGEANHVLRLFLSQAAFFGRGQASKDASVPKSNKKVHAYEKVYNIGNRWICAECVIDRIACKSRPRRRRAHPIGTTSPTPSAEPADVEHTPPEMHASSIFQKVDKVAAMWGNRSGESLENAIGHLKYFLRSRFGHSQGICEPCSIAFPDTQATEVYHIGSQAVCLDCVLERIDSLDRLLYPA